MALDFPSPATVGQTFQSPQGSTWSYDGTKWMPQTSGILQPTNAGRNLATNPCFTVQQRGAGPFTFVGGQAYTADRWLAQFNLDTGMSASITAISDAGRANIGDEQAQYALSSTFTGTSGAAAYSQVGQHVERIRRIANRTITISFWAFASTAGLRLGVNCYLSFGSGGSPSAAQWAQPNGTAVTLTTAWARYSVQVTVPSVSGMTFGTNGDDWFAPYFGLSTGSNGSAAYGGLGVQSGTIQIWGVQLEIGTQASPLDYGGSPQQILAECQRFYQVGAFNLWGYNSAGGWVSYTWAYPVTMRAAPSTTSATGGSTNASNMSISTNGANYCGAQCTATAAGTVQYYGTFTASADL